MAYRGYNFDKDLELKDAGAITADAAAQVGGSARVLDLGPGNRFEGVIVVNVSALDLSSSDETYDIVVQVEAASGFGAPVELVRYKITAIGRYEIPFVNQKGATEYRYLRLFTDVGGTTPSINYTAYAAPLKWA